jgi:hypothetical protein
LFREAEEEEANKPREREREAAEEEEGHWNSKNSPINDAAWSQ